MIKQLAFRKNFDHLMIGYREDQNFKEVMIGRDELNSMYSQQEVTRHLLGILDLLGVDSEFKKQVFEIVRNFFAFPNHIMSQQRIMELFSILSEKFPSVDYHSDEAVAARHAIGVPHENR